MNDDTVKTSVTEGAIYIKHQLHPYALPEIDDGEFWFDTSTNRLYQRIGDRWEGTLGEK